MTQGRVRGRHPGRTAVLAALLVLGQASCTSSPSRETIDIEESSVLSSDLRVLVPVEGADRRQALRDGEANEEAVGMLSGLEVRLTYFSGNSDQTLAAGENIELDDETFTGPGTVDYDFDVLGAIVAWRVGKAFATGVALEALFGLSYHGLDLDAEFMGVTDSESIHSLGPMIGFELGWHTPIRVLVYGRITGAIEVADVFDEAQSTTFEAGLAYPLGKHLDIAAGFRNWRYDLESSSDFNSDIDLEATGPFLSLGFVF